MNGEKHRLQHTTSHEQSGSMTPEQTDGRHGGRTFQELMASVTQSIASMQSPSDFIILLEYTTTIHTSIRILLEAGIFHQLATQSEPRSITQLATEIGDVDQATAADHAAAREEFITRMLRPAAALHLVDQVDALTWQGNELTRTLASPGFDAGFKFMYDPLMGPSSVNSKLVTWATEHHYRAPEDAHNGPYQQAHGIPGTSAFDHWITSNNSILSTQLSHLMKRIQQSRLHWTSWFPSTTLFHHLPSNPSTSTFLVDVGGGLGHDLQALATKYPNQTFQLVSQDLPSLIADARKEVLDPRIQLMEHDFFTPQPVTAAKIYYLHKVLHDWADEQARVILSHLRDAMGPESRIFINDLIVPDHGAPLFMAASDLSMLALLSAKERSDAMWKGLVGSVGGLSIVKFWQAPGLTGEGIVEVGRVG